MLPADQSLRARQHRLLRADVVFRLEENGELFRPDRLPEIIHEPFREQFLFADLLVVEPDHLLRVPADGVGSHFRPVEAVNHVDGLVHVRVDAHPETDMVVERTVGRQTGGRVIQDASVIRTVRTVDHEDVRFPPADDAAERPDGNQQAVADLPEDRVSESHAETVIDDMEVIDIEDDRVHPTSG